MPDNNKILHLISSEGDWEPFVRIVGLAAALREHGYASVVAALDHSRLWELAEAAGVEVLEYSLERSLNPFRWRDLGKAVEASGAGIVHVHDPDSASLLARARMFAPEIRVVSSRYSLHTHPASSEYGSGVAATACPSQLVADAYLRRGAAPEKVHVIYDGIVLSVMERSGEERDVIRAHYRDKYCPSKEKPLFLVSIAPLDEAGAHADLVEVFPEILAVLPQCHLFIMGEGHKRGELERLTKITAVDKDVTFLEPDKAFHRLLAGADVYVGASRDDASGLMLQAAMASGRAAALRKSGCYPELAEDGKTAVFAAADTPQALKDAILDLLENRARREHIGRLAKAKAAKSFNMSEQARLMAEIYRGSAGRGE